MTGVIRTIALIWNELGFSHVVTDDPEIVVISIDEAPDTAEDRIYQLEDGVKRVTFSEMWDLIGNSPIRHKGDRAEIEQAARAMLDRGPDGKPRLRIVKKDEDNGGE